MRDIKFKAWDKVTKKMYTIGFDVRYSGEVVLHKLFWEIIPKLNLLQYTGLKDKNNKEIWEGDIVKTSWGNPSKIVFVNGGFKKGFYDFANNRYIYEEIESTDEVIGNIYDNTELLKE